MERFLKLSLFILILFISKNVVQASYREDFFLEGDENVFTESNLSLQFGVFQEEPLACVEKYSAFRKLCPNIQFKVHTIKDGQKQVGYFFTAHEVGPTFTDLLTDEIHSKPSVHIITEVGILDSTKAGDCFRFMGDWLRSKFNDSHLSFLGTLVEETHIVNLLGTPTTLPTSSHVQAGQLARFAGMDYVSSLKGSRFFHISNHGEPDSKEGKYAVDTRSRLIKFKRISSTRDHKDLLFLGKKNLRSKL